MGEGKLCGEGERCTPVALLALGQKTLKEGIEQTNKSLENQTKAIQSNITNMTEQLNTSLSTIANSVQTLALSIENHNARIQEHGHDIDTIESRLSAGQKCFTQIKVEMEGLKTKNQSTREIAESARSEASKKSPAASNKKIALVGGGTGGGLWFIVEMVRLYLEKRGS